MTAPPHRSPRPLLLLGLGFLMLLGVGGGIAWLLARTGVRAPLRVLLIAPEPPQAAGLDAAECRAIGALVQDHLEQYGGIAITSVTRIPENLEGLRAQPRTLAILLEPVRQGDTLALSYRVLWGDQVRPGRPPVWNLRSALPQPPREAMAGFLREFPATLRLHGSSLCPQNPAAFWDLIQASAWRLRNARLEDALALAASVVAREPECASAWILLGNLRFRRLLDDPGAFRQEQSETEDQLRRGLALAPDLPRGILLLALIQADSGNQAQALALLFKARRRQPHNPTLLTGIAYAARGAGLLRLSSQAMAKRDALVLSNYQPQGLDITRLYMGDLAGFEASLQEQPGHLRSTSGVLPFYRGYLALVRGDRATALQEFRATGTLANGYPNVRRLSEIFALILEGQREPAWQQLREYDQERLGMREPDGEFTLRLAEAYALMGDRASAMDMAGRAFSRGFGCTAWYERSPMLEPLRGLPKWKALRQHLEERQRDMEGQFPLGLLEDN